MKFDLLQILKNKIPKHLVICFGSSLILGWIVHFYALTNKLTNWDDLNCITNFGQGDNLGRWMLKYIHPLGGIYSVPAVHGFLFIFFMSLSACLIMELLHLKSTTSAILIPAVLMTFPSAVSTMSFGFMSHTSAMAICMVCLGVYLLFRYKYGFIPCSILLLCATGTYQSYICFGITLILLGLLTQLLRREADFQQTVKKGILCVVVLGVTVLVYIKLCHVIYPAMEEETYGGFGQMGQIEISQIPKLVGRCYKRFLEYFLWKPFAFVTKTAQKTNIVSFCLAVGLFIYVLIKKKFHKNVLELLLAIVLFVFLPLGAAFIYLMAPDAPFSMLMLYAYALVYVFVLALLEYAVKEWETADFSQVWKKGGAWVCILATVGTVFTSSYCDYLLTNRAYFRVDVSMRRVTSYFNRIIAFAEDTEGFKAGDRLTILGNFYYKDNPSSVELEAFDQEPLRTLDGVALENGLITAGSRDNFVYYYCGYDLADLSSGEKEEIMKSEEYKAMPVYPEQGSVKKIGDVWVVKLCNETQD